MKRKLLATILTMTMALSAAGCGSATSESSSGDAVQDTGSDVESSSDQSEGTESTADDTQVETDTEIWECVVPWPSIGDSPTGLQDVENAVNAISEAEIGVHVTLNPIYCFDLNKQQTLAISSGDKLDLCLIMLETNASYVNNGSIIPLNDLYEQYGSEIAASLGVAVNAGTVGDTLYSIPTGNVYGMGQGFLIRSDLLEKYGYDSTNHDVTVEEMEEILAAIKVGEGDTFYPIAGLPTFELFEAYDELGASLSSGGIFVDGDTSTVVDVYESDEFAEYANTMYRWAQAGYISPDASSTDGGTDLVKSGQYGGQGSSTQPGQNVWAANNSGYDMTSLTVVAPYSKTTSLSNISFGITSNCDNPEKAMQLINLMYSNNSIGTLLSSGIEGVDYVVTDSDDEGHMIVTYPDGLDSSTIPYYNMFGVWPNSKAQLEPLTIDYFQEIADYNADMKYSAAFGYTFDSSAYATQIAAIDSVWSQYQDTIEGGKADPSEILPQFIQALKDAGIDEVIAANQEQYDSWLVSK